jgi:hypothetical protein
MAEENNWKEAEIRRDDIKKLLENTKQLAGMYSEIMGIKKQAWENVLRAKVKKAEKAEREKQNG